MADQSPSISGRFNSLSIVLAVAVSSSVAASLTTIVVLRRLTTSTGASVNDETRKTNRPWWSYLSMDLSVSPKAAASPGRRKSTGNGSFHPDAGGGAKGVVLGATVPPAHNKKRKDPFDPRPRQGYLEWDDYFMAVAFLSAERSKDPNKQVGACIVNEDRVILGIGYNGFPRGCADSQLPWAKQSADGNPLGTKYPYVVHAEANALLNKNAVSVQGAKVYVTMFPCNECAKLLIQAGIKEVVYHEGKIDERVQVGPEQRDEDLRCSCHNSTSSTSIARGAQDRPAGTIAGGGIGQGLGGQHEDGCSHAHILSPKTPARHRHGPHAEPDPCYLASQKLLLLAGIELRQHRLSRTILIQPQ